MARGLALIPLLALLAPGCGLRCKSCQGDLSCPEEAEVTCGPGETSCRTAVRSAAVTFLRFQTVSKGCARRARPDEALALSSHLLALSYRARHCQGDACNAASLAPEPAAPNQLRCHACTSQGAWCPPSARTQLGCTGSQDQCLDLEVTGTLGEFANTKLKGCASLPRCQDGLGFHASSHAIHARCCNTPLCNHHDTDFHTEAELHNGLQCYSCADEDEIGCTSSSMTTVSCVGQHNMCLEGIGRSHSGGAGSVLVTFKGCATPAMCQSSLLALVQELDAAEVFCCTGSLCNTRIMNGQVAEGWPGASPPAPASPRPAPTAATTKPNGMPKDVAREDVVLAAGGARSHGDWEVATTERSEGRRLEDGGDHTVSPSGRQDVTLHPGRLATGGHKATSAKARDNAGSGGSALGTGGATGSPGHGLAAEGAGHSATDSASLIATGGSGTRPTAPSHAGSARESTVAEDRAASGPEGSRKSPGPTPGSPGDRIKAVFPVAQNKSFSQGQEEGSRQPSVAEGGAGAGSYGGQNKTLSTKPLAVAPAGGGLSSRDTARPGAPETGARPAGRWERIEGDLDWPSISFPITVEAPGDALREPRGNASTPGLEPKGPVTNASGSIYTRPPALQKPHPPPPSGAFRLGGSLSLLSLPLLLAALLP